MAPKRTTRNGKSTQDNEAIFDKLQSIPWHKGPFVPEFEMIRASAMGKTEREGIESLESKCADLNGRTQKLVREMVERNATEHELDAAEREVTKMNSKMRKHDAAIQRRMQDLVDWYDGKCTATKKSPNK